MGSGSGKYAILEAAAVTALLAGVLVFATWRIASPPVVPEVAELREQKAFLAGEVEGMRTRLARLEARNAVLEREAEVLRQANQLLREEERERRAEIERQQSELDFFRRLAGAGGAQTGIDVYHAELEVTASEFVHRFTFTLTQNIRRATVVAGKVHIELEGTSDNRPVTLTWQKIGDGDPPSFSFKYFQQIEGYITLPRGFDPVLLRVRLEPNGRDDPVEREFEWTGLVDPEYATASPPAA